MNVAKLTAKDAPLFDAFLVDLFPEAEMPSTNREVVTEALRETLDDMRLQPHHYTMSKCLQLIETMAVRHATMCVGASGTGKSSVWRAVKQAQSGPLRRLYADAFQPVVAHAINPKSLSLGELYGQYDMQANEWLDGVLSNTMRQCCTDKQANAHWLLFDAPVDTTWVESMNSVMVSVLCWRVVQLASLAKLVLRLHCVENCHLNTGKRFTKN